MTDILAETYERLGPHLKVPKPTYTMNLGKRYVRFANNTGSINKLELIDNSLLKTPFDIAVVRYGFYIKTGVFENKLKYSYRHNSGILAYEMIKKFKTFLDHNMPNKKPSRTALYKWFIDYSDFTTNILNPGMIELYNYIESNNGDQKHMKNALAIFHALHKQHTKK